MKYKIVTVCEAISEYIVEAKTPHKAEEKFNNGDCKDFQTTDYRNEEIITIKETK